MFEFSEFTDPTSPLFISSNEPSNFTYKESQQISENKNLKGPPKPILDRSYLKPIFNKE